MPGDGHDQGGPAVRRLRAAAESRRRDTGARSFAARQIEEQGANASTAFALTTLAEVYGNDVRAAFKGAVASHWGRDPFALGAWCAASKAAAATLALPHNERVFFAGEATADNAGTLDAAWASGLRAAGEAKALLR